MFKPDRDGVLERNIAVKLRGRTPSLLQDCASLSARLGLTAESGLNSGNGRLELMTAFWNS
jgi:hypothetical protein